MKGAAMTAAIPRTVLDVADPPSAANEPVPAPPAAATPALPETAATGLSADAIRRRRREVLLRVLAPVIGVIGFVGLWALVASGGAIPGPGATWDAAKVVFADPFYRNGPNDQGIGWKILNSLGRVGMGFGLAALAGIPLGFMIGRFTFLRNACEPIISLLRPVSPLAWLPIGLLVFKGAHPAAIYTIFISSIWPMIINTAVGVQRIPQDYMNVARVLNLSEWKIFTKILFPAVLPYMLTGVRLSIGVAWLVIVAAEMLTGGVGLGFWVWDEWNNLKVENILIAIVVIGVIGLALEQTLILIARRFEHGGDRA
jgi:nitrate/nitrite transport system permease protein